MSSYTYTCPTCPAIKVEHWDLVTSLDRVPYCDYCERPMVRFYGSATA